jgi:transposase
MNSISFADFLARSLIGYSGYHIILDNVSFHKSKLVLDVLQKMGVTPLYIDPYTPEQNPIEEVFSTIKGYIKSMSPTSVHLFDKRLRTAMRRQKKMTLVKCFRRSVSFST